MLLAKVSPQAGKDQNGKTSAVKAPRRDMKTFKNVDSKLANLILNEIVDRYFFFFFLNATMASVHFKGCCV